MGSKATHKRRLKVRIKAILYLGGKCIRCGHTGNAATFEFHHRDPSKKDFGISTGNTNSWEKVKKEVDKCDLLCSNCHREIHYTSQELELQVREELKKEAELEPIKKKCVLCGQPTTKTGIRCVSCFRKSIEKIKWPTNKELLRELESTSYVELGKRLGVSDKAIRKRLQNHC